MYSVYCIKNRYNGRVYVGSTVDLHKRIIRHFYLLRLGTHKNRRLQKDFNRYEGKDAFEVYVLCEAKTKDKALLYEQIFIDGFSDTYNILPKAGSAKGRIYTKQTLSRMSESAKRRSVRPPRKTKLNESDVFEILKRRSNGETYASIARDYGVTKNAVGSIVRGEVWVSVHKKFKYRKEKR